MAAAEDAGINATGVPQTFWIDGWLARCGPGKARRCRCINALAPGRRPLADRLAEARAVFQAAGLPMYVRITPFTAPVHAGGPALEPLLVDHGFRPVDRSRVMILPDLRASASAWPAHRLPVGLRWEDLNGSAFAEAVGALRESTPVEIAGHAARLASSPVRYRGLCVRRQEDGAVMACAQTAAEAGRVGLYDVFTAPDARGQGLSRALCERLLSESARSGAVMAYLQVDAGNDVAMRLYARMGFADAFGYHYLEPPQ